MRVLVPHREGRLAPETQRALAGKPGVFFKQIGSTPQGYYYWLRMRLFLREPWINVEQDNVPSDEALQDLWDCPEPWCAQPYLYELFPGMLTHIYGLGCTKFGAGVMEPAYKAMATEVRARKDGEHEPLHWCRLDAWLQEALAPPGIVIHRHGIEVGHVNTRPSHGCGAWAQLPKEALPK